MKVAWDATFERDCFWDLPCHLCILSCSSARRVKSVKKAGWIPKAPSNVWCSLLTRMSCCEKRLGKLELSDGSCLVSLSKLSLGVPLSRNVRGRYLVGEREENI